MSVAQNVKACRILLKLPVKIIYMAVRISLTKYGYKSEYISLKIISLAIGLDQSLSCDLRGSVKRRLHRKRRVLGCRYDLCLAVYRSCRRKPDTLYIILPHGFKDPCRIYRVLLEILERMLKTSSHISICRKMKDKINTLHRFIKDLFILKPCLYQIEIGIP